MDITNYCDVEMCIALAELGYNNGCEYTWTHNCRVSDEILAKHPGLSDSGYMDLIDEYDGPYKRVEVYHTYTEPIKRFSRNSMIDTDLGEICSCVHLYDAQKWLREEKKIEIVVLGQNNIGGPYYPDIYTEDGLMNNAKGYKTYEEALLEGIKEAIKLLKEEK